MTAFLMVSLHSVSPPVSMPTKSVSETLTNLLSSPSRASPLGRMGAMTKYLKSALEHLLKFIVLIFAQRLTPFLF